MARAFTCVPPLLQFGALAVGGVEMARELTCMRDTTMCKINFAGLKGIKGSRIYLCTGAFLLGGPPVCWENGSRVYLSPPFAIRGASSRRGRNGLRVYLYTGAFLLGGPPVCWENGSRACLCPPFLQFGALAVGAVEMGRAFTCM